MHDLTRAFFLICAAIHLYAHCFRILEEYLGLLAAGPSNTMDLKETHTSHKSKMKTEKCPDIQN